MKKHGATGLIFLVLLLSNSPARAEEIIVSAAASLTDALREIGKAYQVKSQNKVTFSFGASSDLARQIDEGAPVDLFFSADVEKMENLEKKGRIEGGSRKNLLSNQLVIVVPKESRLTIRSPVDLLQANVKRIALAEPSSVPVGIYARKYLEGEGVWEKVKGKVVPVLDVRATLASVESGNVDVGFIYKTDAAISKRVKVVYEVTREKGPKIIYPVAIVKESSKKKSAGDFLRFVLSEAGKKIFEKFGFVVLE
ncbi:MAG: molybdate ABC transporter substrate-binding protein [Candidatus Binatia bacterium]